MLVRTSLLPRQFDALTVWPLILIRPEAAARAALVAHERVHFRDQQRLAWIAPAVLLLLVMVSRLPVWVLAAALIPGVCAAAWWLPYALVEAFCLQAEVKAFRVEIAMGGITAAAAARRLSTRYCPGTSEAAALALLETRDA